jgi:hypothetical protein
MRARVRAVWGSATRWERLALVVALLPIPGPLDELLGLLVARRVAARIARNARLRLGPRAACPPARTA